MLRIILLLCLCLAVRANNCADPGRIYDTAITYVLDDTVPAEGGMPLSAMDPERNTFEYREQSYAWFQTAYGIELDPTIAGIQEIPGFTHLIWKVNPGARMTVYSIDDQERRQSQGKLPLDNAEFRDDGYMLIALEDVLVHGAYGGEAGKIVKAGSFILTGVYRLFVNNEWKDDLRYYSNCPVEPNTQGQIPVNCDVESDRYGSGHTGGASVMFDQGNGMVKIQTKYFMTFPRFRADIDPSNPKHCANLAI